MLDIGKRRRIAGFRCSAMSRSRRRMIFPLLVLGRSGVNAIHFGLRSARSAWRRAREVRRSSAVALIVRYGSQRHERGMA